MVLRNPREQPHLQEEQCDKSIIHHHIVRPVDCVETWGCIVFTLHIVVCSEDRAQAGDENLPHRIGIPAVALAQTSPLWHARRTANLAQMMLEMVNPLLYTQEP